MHYKINDHLIKSESAARSYLQKSKQLVEIINSLDKVDDILDYGCGKLRYSLELRKKCNNLVLIDSAEQINKKQIIHGVNTSVKDYVNNYMADTLLYETSNVSKVNKQFDFILFANVLNSIPCQETQENCLENINKLLKPDGKALFVNQYSNSFFNEIPKKKNVIKHLDGYIVPNRNGVSYYGIIRPDKMELMLNKSNFDILNRKLKDGSFYIVARKQKNAA